MSTEHVIPVTDAVDHPQGTLARDGSSADGALREKSDFWSHTFPIYKGQSILELEDSINDSKTKSVKQMVNFRPRANRYLKLQ